MPRQIRHNRISNTACKLGVSVLDSDFTFFKISQMGNIFKRMIDIGGATDIIIINITAAKCHTHINIIALTQCLICLYFCTAQAIIIKANK